MSEHHAGSFFIHSGADIFDEVGDSAVDQPLFAVLRAVEGETFFTFAMAVSVFGRKTENTDVGALFYLS